MKRAAKRIITFFLLTIITAVRFHNFLHMPSVIGMLTGLAYLQLFGYFLKKTAHCDTECRINHYAVPNRIAAENR